MKQRRFEVYRQHRLTDILYCDPDMTAKQVRDSLINHDGYLVDISVYRMAADRPAFDDCARASHPEEI